jgi:hypothetical protein
VPRAPLARSTRATGMGRMRPNRTVTTLRLVAAELRAPAYSPPCDGANLKLTLKLCARGPVRLNEHWQFLNRHTVLNRQETCSSTNSAWEIVQSHKVVP